MLSNEFRELRHSSTDGLMYIKEDLILPHTATFYDFIVNKSRGKSGPLFHFDVHDDVSRSRNLQASRRDFASLVDEPLGRSTAARTHPRMLSLMSAVPTACMSIASDLAMSPHTSMTSST